MEYNMIFPRELESVSKQIKDIAYVSYTLFKSTYNQIRFVRLRENSAENQNNMVEILEDEIVMAEKVYKIMMKIPEIGFEAANHYYFNSCAVAEKIINCKHLIQCFKETF